MSRMVIVKLGYYTYAMPSHTAAALAEAGAHGQLLEVISEDVGNSYLYKQGNGYTSIEIVGESILTPEQFEFEKFKRTKPSA